VYFCRSLSPEFQAKRAFYRGFRFGQAPNAKLVAKLHNYYICSIKILSKRAALISLKDLAAENYASKNNTK